MAIAPGAKHANLWRHTASAQLSYEKITALVITQVQGRLGGGMPSGGTPQQLTIAVAVAVALVVQVVAAA